MHLEHRWEHQQILTHKIARATILILPQGEGIHMRYIKQQIPNSDSLTFEDLAEVVVALR